MADRPSWDDYFIEMAKLAAKRSTCPRRQVGCVLVKDNRLVATGYNGSVRGAPHCDEVGCLMVKNGDRESCVRTVHAELNALLQCAVNGVSSQSATLFATDFPCVSCAKAIVQAGIERVVYLSEYPDPNSTEILQAGNVHLQRASAGADGRFHLESTIQPAMEHPNQASEADPR